MAMPQSATTRLFPEFEQILPAEGMPRLLLHCCCAPCASSVIEQLSPYFSIALLFYNPNIRPREEHDKRAADMGKLLASGQFINGIELIIRDGGVSDFDGIIRAFPDEAEGGERCKACFELRLAETALDAKTGGYDCFATTLSVSPHKNAALINSIGSRLADEQGIRFLQADFKKRDGYKRSVELSKLYGLYRQDYCGCRRSGLR